MSFPSRLSVLVAGSSAPGSAGSGICFTQTTMFMARFLFRVPATAKSAPHRAHRGPRGRRSRAGRTVLSGREGPAGRQLLGVVGHRPRPRGRSSKALSADHDVDGRRDQPAGPRHPAGPGRGGRRHRRRRRPRRRRHAERGRQRPGRHRPPPWPPLPGGSTNVFARTLGLPDDPIEATGALLDALAAGSIRRVGLGSVNGRYFLFHVGMGFDAAVVQQVERRSSLKRYASHPLFVYAGDRHLRCATTTARGPHFAVQLRRRARSSTTATSPCASTPPRTPTSAPCRRPRPRRHPRPRRSSWSPCRTHEGRPPSSGCSARR